MSSALLQKKRRLDPDREISPPPLRRKSNGMKSDDTAVTPEAEQQNNPTIETAKELSSALSIISWNVNGFAHLLPKTQRSIKNFLVASSASVCEDERPDPKSSPMRKFLERHDFPAILCLQEVKIAPNDLKTKLAVEKAANSHADNGPNYKAHFSLPRDTFNARGWGGKVYGVCTLVRNDLPVSTTEGVTWDLEGRVLVTKFASWKLAIINGYWVNGTMNPYRDSATGQIIGTRHDRKRAFHSLMLDEVKALERAGYHVLLIGDMNVARTPIDGYPGIRLGIEHVMNRKDFNDKFFDGEEGMRGLDAWRYVHGDRRGYTYHGERVEEWGTSCDRVDLGIVSRGLVEIVALVGADIWESVEERGGSDHVPLGVMLDTRSLEKYQGVGD